ncbi:MAG: zf-HC2 domain-containing protein [Vicinamibacterales bacterium]
MIRYLTCDAAAELLDAFVDGELWMVDQVAVESHLRWCRVCEARVEDMRLVGVSLRGHVYPASTGFDDGRDLAIVQSSVLARIRAERDQSAGVRFRGLFVDLRFLWPAVGACSAVALCLYVSLSVFIAATEDETRDSLAGMIQFLANPGSDENPLSLGGRLSAPRALDAGAVLESIMDDEAVYALSAVVTREGRVSTYELLLSERASERRRNTAAEAGEDVSALLHAVKSSRFEPAQNAAGGAVAVNMVWLVARTTVKGSVHVAVPSRRGVIPAERPSLPKPEADAPVDPPPTEEAPPTVSST